MNTLKYCAFRITNHSDPGLGHVMRCLHLATALSQHQVKICFILDEVSSYIRDKLANFTVFTLPEHQQRVPDCLNQLIDKYQFTHLVVDSYTLDYDFECCLSHSDTKIIVIDDLLRPHHCDMIIDYKWIGESTAQRYQNLVPEQCKKLLGPAYALLHPDYKELCYSAQSDKEIILFSLGGGGDLALFCPVISLLRQHPQLSSVHFQIVVGPEAQNLTALQSTLKHSTHVEWLYQPDSLASYFKNAHFFVGALGTAFYELALCHLPAITFSLTRNQANSPLELEKLGHFLHLGRLNPAKADQLVALIVESYKQRSRLQALLLKAECDIDPWGADRVASSILGLPTKTPPEGSERDSSIVAVLTDQYHIATVTDQHLNHYYVSRMHPANNDNMAVQTIDPIEHYNWWLTQQRENFILYQTNRSAPLPILYIWHQSHGHDYLFGGWFVCAEGDQENQPVSFSEAWAALNWQIEHCRKRYPNRTWLAVIKKHNQFVSLLNKKMGFQPTPIDSKHYHATRELFPHASALEFNYVYLPAPENTQ